MAHFVQKGLVMGSDIYQEQTKTSCIQINLIVVGQRNH